MLCEQPPPRKDTPFWIIANTYDQVCDVCWSEKLLGHGHIPESEIEWEKVAWFSEKENRPKSVPLKPWPQEHGGDPKKNWRIEFKSYEQGRTAMQARSIGGFWFSEQFPLEIFLEVLRGCREYMFPGGQFAEFTPIDPQLSIWVEKAMDDPPPGWKFYRANTLKNKPNLKDGWFEQFFSLVPDEMVDTRMTGALANFEGIIYPSFNPEIHVVDAKELLIPRGCSHALATDWGASAEHPFAVIFGCRDGMGDWICYDEYWSPDQNKVTEDHANEVLDTLLVWGWPIVVSTDEFGRVTRKMDPKRDALWVGNFGDPARPGEIRMFQKMGIETIAARNAVYDGINVVRSLFKTNPRTGRPRVIISSRCKHLIEELRKYRWKRGKKATSGNTLNPAVARPEPLKRNDDCCLVGDTMVQCKTHHKQLKDIKQGDILLSHLGECVALTDAVCTRRDSEVVRLTFEDGSSVVATPSHKFAEGSSQWTEARAMEGRIANGLLYRPSCDQLAGTGLQSKKSNMRAGSGLDIQGVSSSRLVGTFTLVEEKHGKRCTGEFTKTSLGTSHTASISTTATTTLQITSLAISRRYPNPSTPSTISRTARWAEYKKNLRSISIASIVKSRFRSDTKTASEESTVLKIARLQRYKRIAFARSVETQSPERQLAREQLAARNANSKSDPSPGKKCTPRSANKGCIPQSFFVSAAESLSPVGARKLARKNVRPLSVVKVERLPGKVDVYNVATSDGTFFANGVLASNCDALRYLIYSNELDLSETIASMSQGYHATDRASVQLKKLKDATRGLLPGLIPKRA